MSWFSNRFSASFRPSEDPPGHGDQDDEHTSQGKGVKEDLSELTKTFTKQLWGVASFLAPPPPPKSKNEQVDPSSSSPSDGPSHPDLQIEPFSRTSGMAMSNELVDVDFQASMDPENDLQEEAISNLSQSETSAHDQLLPLQGADHRFTGIGKDLAELKGSVATGFSKILKVVREEIDRDEQVKGRSGVDVDVEKEDDADEPKTSAHARKLPVFNSLFRPLLSSILHDDGDEASRKKKVEVDFDDEDEGFDDDPSDVRGHQMSRPLAALNLQRTLGESLGGISKFASSLFPVNLDSDDENDAVEKQQIQQAVGVTEEVLAFARNVSMHPETWLDFPLFTDDEEDDDFEMSDVQNEHVHEVELASPRLAALRIELCPDYMSEGRFWKIYFVLLHSRLSKKDAMLLSTPQIIEARALLLSNLQNKESPGSKTGHDGGQHEFKGKEDLSSFKIVSLQSAMEVPAKDFDQIEHLGGNSGRPQGSGQMTTDMGEEVQNKNVLASTVKLAALNYEEEEADADRWLDEEQSPHLAATGLANEDDVSFSDLEEDDGSTTKDVGSSDFKRSHGWVELENDQEEHDFEGVGISSSKSKLDGCSGEQRILAGKKQERRESSDWLTVEEDDDFA